MGRNEKKGHGGKHSRPKKWSGARRPAGPATTALGMLPQKNYEKKNDVIWWNLGRPKVCYYQPKNQQF